MQMVDATYQAYRDKGSGRRYLEWLQQPGVVDDLRPQGPKFTGRGLVSGVPAGRRLPRWWLDSWQGWPP